MSFIRSHPLESVSIRFASVIYRLRGKDDADGCLRLPRSGRIAAKAINHLGDEVMKVFSVGQGCIQ